MDFLLWCTAFIGLLWLLRNYCLLEAQLIERFIYWKQHIQSLDINGGTFFLKRIILKSISRINIYIWISLSNKTNIHKGLSCYDFKPSISKFNPNFYTWRLCKIRQNYFLLIYSRFHQMFENKIFVEHVLQASFLT